MTAPTVSVVLPFLNGERFLGEAIESVLAQTFEAWELLLVDDGSSDRSAEIALDHVSRDPKRIAYLRHPGGRRRGISASRNVGIAHAAGEYIAFLDADDVWLPRKLEQQTELLASHSEAGMLYGLSQWWYSWSGNPADADRDFVHALGVRAGTLIEPPELLRPFFVLQEAAIPNPPNILVRRAAVERVGGFEEQFVGLYEDQAFYAKVCVHAPVVAYDCCWDRYRQHPDAVTAIASGSNGEVAARRVFLAWLIEYLERHGVDRKIRAALRRQYFHYSHPQLGRIFGGRASGGRTPRRDSRLGVRIRTRRRR
jgi:glycosyltransferase involved in cell wall biosynthesis